MKKILKNNETLFVYFSIGLLVILVSSLTFCCKLNKLNGNNTLYVDYGMFLITTSGVLIAYIKINQYLKEKDRQKNDFLDLSVVSEVSDGHVKIISKIFNQSNYDKDVDFSILLISKQMSNFDFVSYIDERMFHHLLGMKFTNDLIKLKSYFQEGQIEKFGNDENENNWEVMIVPIPFYYEENVRIGNENLSFSFCLPTTDFEDNTAYSVRFFIFPKQVEGKTKYHRSTADSFYIH